MRRQLIACVMLLAAGTPVSAVELELQSGPHQTVMIELYTSEGCSSCPPAERYLSQFVHAPQLWQTYIPLAFHVDYWDYLGWRDQFATSANTQRQQTYGKVLQARTIYTPEFFVNGKEWRHGLSSGLPGVSAQAVGVLRVSLRGRRIRASFVPTDRHTLAPQLHLAVLGMGLQREITAGENAGRHATHEFAVLAHTWVESPTQRWQTSLPDIGDHLASRLALVVWVSTRDNPAPVQATGGFLPPSLGKQAQVR